MHPAASFLFLLLAFVGSSGLSAAGNTAATEASAATARAERARPAPSSSWLDAFDGPRVEIVVDLTNPASAEMKVTQHYQGLLPEMWGLKQIGNNKEVQVYDIEVEDADGAPVSFTRRGNMIQLKGDKQSELVVTYRAKPGGQGRHGLQGIITADWSTFDGRVFLLPTAAAELQGARIRFEVPDDWITGSPLLEKEGWLYAEQYGRGLIHTSLSTACFGVGPQARHISNVNGIEVRVFTPMSSPPAERARLDRETVAVVRWFNSALNFQPDFPMAWVWTPFRNGKRVYGGSAAHGTCMEQPKSRTRAWELMAHRLAHSMNKYPPSGMHIRDSRDHWFEEGWPSYIEIEAVTGSGVRHDALRWNLLYKRYLRVRRNEPEQDLAMINEPDCRGETCEYMHYFKAPIVVKMLDDFIVRHHDGKNLTEFMALMFDKYGSFGGDLPLREELEEYVGASLDPFWEVFVDRRGFHYPAWPEAIDIKVRVQAEKSDAATVAGRPVSGDYLYHLAASGDFAHFEDIVTFLEREEARRVQLAEVGIRLLPPGLDKVRAGFDPETRYNIALAELSYPYFPQEVSTEGIVLEWTGGDPDAETFQELLADEARYHETMPGTGLKQLKLFTAKNGKDFGDAAVLAFEGSVRTRLISRWHWSPPLGTVKLGRDDLWTEERSLIAQPDWTIWRTIHSSRQRPKGDGVVTYEIHGISEKPVVRSFWQRGE